MGLFTNRKRDEEDLAGLSEAASMLAQFGNSPADQPGHGESAELLPDVTPVMTEDAHVPAPPPADDSPVGSFKQRG